ncbi:hypothetical protein FOXYSP1_18039 [Fusarium oxysporum f. sp. phaseoli]
MALATAFCIKSIAIAVTNPTSFSTSQHQQLFLLTSYSILFRTSWPQSSSPPSSPPPPGPAPSPPSAKTPPMRLPSSKPAKTPPKLSKADRAVDDFFSMREIAARLVSGVVFLLLPLLWLRSLPAVRLLLLWMF